MVFTRFNHFFCNLQFWKAPKIQLLEVMDGDLAAFPEAKQLPECRQPARLIRMGSDSRKFFAEETVEGAKKEAAHCAQYDYNGPHGRRLSIRLRSPIQNLNYRRFARFVDLGSFVLFCQQFENGLVVLYVAVLADILQPDARDFAGAYYRVALSVGLLAFEFAQ